MANNQSLFLLNAFDSHVHWAGTGAAQSILDLASLNDATAAEKLSWQPHHKRHDWLVGYNFDETHWKEPPHRKILDNLDHKGPILFHRVDRHAAWVNTHALKIAGFWKKWESPNIEGGIINLDNEGWPTGYLVDRAMDILKEHLPAESSQTVSNCLLEGQRVFHQAGYTHIRDMTCSEVQWNEAVKLYEHNQLQMAVEQNFNIDNFGGIDGTLQFMRKIKNNHPHLLRPVGVKMYYDGALGSEGALLSCPYHGNGTNCGFSIFEAEVMKEMIRKTWEQGWGAAVHTIGDEAADHVVNYAFEIYQSGLKGELHLEHAELLRPDTIKKMKLMNVTCHMQPCHWLTDKAWAKEKLPTLFQHLFRWRMLEDEGIKFDYGSDAPIEPSSILRNIKAVDDAAQYGIMPTRKSSETYMSHKDINWVPNCQTKYNSEKILKTVFDDTVVYESPN